MTNASNNNFEWTRYYSEFANKLCAYHDNRSELLLILESVYKELDMKYPFDYHGDLLNDIDPFTIFGSFNKGITNNNRTRIMSAIGKHIGVELSPPDSFDGIPVMNNMQSWFIRANVNREADDIDKLWHLFLSAIAFADESNENTKAIFIENYNKAASLPLVSWNITMGLYWTRPFFFINLDRKNREILLNQNLPFAVDVQKITDFKKLPNAKIYLTLINMFHDKFENNIYPVTSFPELSQSAWLTSTSEKQEKAISKASFIQWFEPLIGALKDLGGSATPEAARIQIIENLNLSSDIVNETRGKTGTKKFDNEVAWARNYLAYEGIIDKSTRGIWALTEKGMSVEMNREIASEIFFKWVDILKERRDNAQKAETADRATSEKHFWMYAPGEGSRKWEEFHSQSIMGIGWDNLGDLTQYADREAMRAKMKELYDESKTYKNDSLATWQFAHAIREGDIVFAKKGLHEIIGRGVVESNYYFDPSRDEYKNVRKIRWTHEGSWKHPSQTVIKTLTDITSYTDEIQKLELLIAENDAIEEIETDEEILYKEYTDEDFLAEVFMEPTQYEMIVALLKNKKNIILQGAPGVGKTFAAKRLAYSIIGAKDTSRVMIVQFHQSYSYEDFIMGFRPTKEGFELTPGPFYQFCKKAQDDIERDYFFVIDEINRGNLSKIFGELLMLIESDKRGEKLRLLYANELFSVPSNLHIIGLMNTADRSLAMIDYALRRRFAFYEIEPSFDSDGFQRIMEIANNIKFSKLVDRVKELNDAISKDDSLGDGFRIGHSYFCTENEVNDSWLEAIVQFELLPLLGEYWFDEKSKVDEWTKKLRGALND